MALLLSDVCQHILPECSSEDTALGRSRLMNSWYCKGPVLFKCHRGPHVAAEKIYLHVKHDPALEGEHLYSQLTEVG